MKLSIGIFFGGLFGALGILIYLVAFGSDYWLLAKEIEKCSENQETGDNATHSVLLHHEGFFWRCWFNHAEEENSNTMENFWFTNQAPTKNCTHAYLSPFPQNRDNSNSTSYHSALVYRGFWNIFMLLGVVTAVIGGFLIICAAPFTNHRIYKAGGGLFITSGILFALVVVMHVFWVQSVSDIKGYTDTRQQDCSQFTVYVSFGWSFMLAPFGIFFCLFAGMLFLLVGHTIHVHTK
ncbi:transmembrane protein 182 precursor [Xenopus tropicalis]|uniref:Transmembrane protein 182 n=2 Tax=Xenopus tropicalis TaxID=8364 RepID=TM182_XENTR|eukprot:NP_001072403.1 transmembrane protein 182 precursor [Xenopus tropicalis]